MPTRSRLAETLREVRKPTLYDTEASRPLASVEEQASVAVLSFGTGIVIFAMLQAHSDETTSEMTGHAATAT